MRTKTLYSQDEKKAVSINRELLRDGYNYYLSFLTLSELHNVYFINDNVKQIETILSYKAALTEANQYLTN